MLGYMQRGMTKINYGLRKLAYTDKREREKRKSKQTDKRDDDEKDWVRGGKHSKRLEKLK